MSPLELEKLKKVLDQVDREDAYQLLVELVAEYGWLTGRSAEDVVPEIRSACYEQELGAED